MLLRYFIHWIKVFFFSALVEIMQETPKPSSSPPYRLAQKNCNEEKEKFSNNFSSFYFLFFMTFSSNEKRRNVRGVGVEREKLHYNFHNSSLWKKIILFASCLSSSHSHYLVIWKFMLRRVENLNFLNSSTD